ncbi:hypothetical protein ACJX0I_05440 [Enterobacter hormaechei subsp. xiangfangensis]|uniref:Uncharacterized protein n=1 Tax=Enterobacter sichuanensis TaxID=2071710 RepID=A0ABS6GDG3_9ENTR|nr:MULTISPECIES: hypothetical protein [Enterobacter cloacae complex]EJH8725755.1 hypothetical protein [Cronobacter sakazakii]EJW0553504.1 hypothetical protein [Escherichia coli]EJJ0564462.1 hypothetical protein [Cronobacter sakazakii]EKK4738693.1 hypothetical protein [Cronobacter sakazakii]ELY2748590.1 hypothetical protein [Cronobacter sakazakii]
MSIQQATGVMSQPTTTYNQAAVEKILDALEQTGELAYLARVASPYGFQITGRWASTKKNILTTLSNPDLANKLATEKTLRMIFLRIITSINHFYSIDYIKGGDVNGISKFVGFTNFEKVFNDAFPLKLDESNGLPPSQGNFITAVEDMGDGIAVIFSYVLMKKISGRSKLRANQYPVQYFNTVFIPNDLSRVEYRIDRKLGRRACDRALVDLRMKFIEFLAENKVSLQVESVNFFKAIDNIYKDKAFGRLVQVDFIEPKSDEDATLRCRTKPSYDARNRNVVETKDGDLSKIDGLRVRGVAVRFDYKIGDENLTNEIGFDPNKKDWAENDFCDTFYFSKMSENMSHFGVINDILKRAL